MGELRDLSHISFCIEHSEGYLLFNVIISVRFVCVKAEEEGSYSRAGLHLKVGLGPGLRDGFEIWTDEPKRK